MFEVSLLEYQIVTQSGPGTSGLLQTPALPPETWFHPRLCKQRRKKKKGETGCLYPSHQATQNTAAMSKFRPLCLESTAIILYWARLRQWSLGHRRKGSASLEMCINDKLSCMGLPRDTEVSTTEEDSLGNQNKSQCNSSLKSKPMRRPWGAGVVHFILTYTLQGFELKFALGDMETNKVAYRWDSGWLLTTKARVRH